MVRLLLICMVLGGALLGCGSSEEAKAQRERPLTVDEQIAKIEQRKDIPEDIKAQTIASLRQQANAQQAAQSK